MQYDDFKKMRVSYKPSRFGNDHLGAECVELSPEVAVVERDFDVLVRSLVDARSRRGPGSRRQHVPRHAWSHRTRVIAATERAALTCTANSQ